MANFDSGVADYVRAYAVVRVGFPIDYKGNADLQAAGCTIVVSGLVKAASKIG